MDPNAGPYMANPEKVHLILGNPAEFRTLQVLGLRKSTAILRRVLFASQRKIWKPANQPSKPCAHGDFPN